MALFQCAVPERRASSSWPSDWWLYPLPSNTRPLLSALPSRPFQLPQWGEFGVTVNNKSLQFNATSSSSSSSSSTSSSEIVLFIDFYVPSSNIQNTYTSFICGLLSEQLVAKKRTLFLFVAFFQNDWSLRRFEAHRLLNFPGQDPLPPPDPSSYLHGTSPQTPTPPQYYPTVTWGS